MQESSLYLVFIYALGVLFLVAAVAVLYWCAKSGQLRNFDKGARVIFTEDEPGGVHRDLFPGKKGEKDKRKFLEHERKAAQKNNDSGHAG